MASQRSIQVSAVVYSFGCSCGAQPAVFAPHHTRALELFEEQLGKRRRGKEKKTLVELAIDVYAIDIRRQLGSGEALFVKQRKHENGLECMSRDAQRIGLERGGSLERA